MKQDAARRLSFWVSLAVCLTLSMALAAALCPTVTLPTALDEEQWHLPQILALAETFPKAAVDSTIVPMPLLYHWVVAGFSSLVTEDVRGLRLLQLALGIGLTSISYALLRRRLSADTAALSAVAVGLSPAVFGSAVRLTTDVPCALLCLAALLLLCESGSRGNFLLASLTALAAILTRQTSVWLIPLIALAVLQPRRTAAVYSRVASVALPVLGLLGLMWLWGGALPPQMAEQHLRFPNTLGPLTILTIIGAYSLPFLVIAIPPDRSLIVRAATTSLGATALLAWTAPGQAGTFAEGPLRDWTARGPWVAGLPAGQLTLAFIGGTFVAMVVMVPNSRSEKLAIAGLAAHAAISLFLWRAFERYYEPYMVLFVMWFAASRSRSDQRYRLSAAALVFAGICAHTIYWIWPAVFGS